MSDKEKIEQLEREIEELKSVSEYYKGECNSYWADLRKRQKLNLEIAQKIVKTDSKAIANIILNMYFGKMPSDSCGFCEIFDLKGKGCCKEGLRCTDCIDNFLRQQMNGTAAEVWEESEVEEEAEETLKKMENKFKCKIEKAGYCDQWKRECVSWNNCNLKSYDAPCPGCVASSPIDHERCSGCKYQKWKQDNYSE